MTSGRFQFEVDYCFFDKNVWLKLAHLVPAFERIKVNSSWVWHYGLNTFDGTVILAPWTGGLENYYSYCRKLWSRASARARHRPGNS